MRLILYKCGKYRFKDKLTNQMLVKAKTVIII